MRPTVLISGISAVILSLAGLMVLNLAQIERAPTAAAKRAGSEGPGVRPRQKAARPVASGSAEAETRLMSLLKSRDSTLASFGDVETYAKSLSDNALLLMIEEGRVAHSAGYGPWIRCALFAEWGRRHPEQSIAYLQEPPPAIRTYQSEGWDKYQSWFSLFRGWAEVDPGAALARLKKPGLKGNFWYSYAYNAIFGKLLERDGPEAAWAAMTEDVPRHGALKGLFRAARNKQERRAFVERWMKETEPANQEKNGKSAFLVSGPFSVRWQSSVVWRGISFPREAMDAKGIYLVSVAGELAKADLQSAIDWLETEFPGGPDLFYGHSVGGASGVLREWAMDHVDEALQYLDAGRYEPKDLVSGILAGDPLRAPDVINRIDESERFKVLQDVFRIAAGELRRKYHFPSPDWPTVQQSDPRRFFALRQAIENAGLNAKQTAELGHDLARAFRWLNADGTPR